MHRAGESLLNSSGARVRKRGAYEAPFVLPLPLIRLFVVAGREAGSFIMHDRRPRGLLTVGTSYLTAGDEAIAYAPAELALRSRGRPRLCFDAGRASSDDLFTLFAAGYCVVWMPCNSDLRPAQRDLAMNVHQAKQS